MTTPRKGTKLRELLDELKHLTREDGTLKSEAEAVKAVQKYYGIKKHTRYAWRMLHVHTLLLSLIRSIERGYMSEQMADMILDDMDNIFGDYQGGL